MQSVKLYYNPRSGEKNHSIEKLPDLISREGFRIIKAVHHKKGLAPISRHLDIVAIAGGDGTIRRACTELLELPLKDYRPFGILPLGTANNIAHSLQIKGSISAIIHSWKKQQFRDLDIGRIFTDKEKEDFFIESCGWGLFPQLIDAMSKAPKDLSPEKEMQTALEMLMVLALEAKAVDCTLRLDGEDHSGKFLMLEMMNIRQLGPRLQLAPAADSGDGYLDICFIREEQRSAFYDYLRQTIRDRDLPSPFPTIRAKKVEISWARKLAMHVDDQFSQAKADSTFQIDLSPARFRILC